MTEHDLTPSLKPNLFLFNKESISESMRGVNNLIIRQKKGLHKSVDKKLKESKQEKILQLTRIYDDLQKLHGML